MSHDPAAGRAGWRFILANGFWIAAAGLVVAGFVLRWVAGLLELPHLRLGGIVVMALGLAAALLGWASERLARR